MTATVRTLASVLVVEPDPLTRRAVTALLGHHGAAGVITAESGSEAVDVLRSRPVKTVVSEVTLPDMPFAAFAAAARDLNPTIVLAVLTGETDGRLLRAATATSRVCAVLSKYGEPEFLAERLLMAGRGGLILDDAVWRILAHERSEPETHHWVALSQRERQVLALVAQGLSMTAIGRRLRLAESTVKTHAARAAIRLGVETSREAARQAMRLGLLSGVVLPGDEDSPEVIDLRAGGGRLPGRR